MSQTIPSILFFDQFSNIGGGQTVLLQLVAIAQSQGFSVSVMAPAEGDLIHQLHAMGVKQYFPLPNLDMSFGKKNIYDVFKMLFFIPKFLVSFWRLPPHQIYYVNGPRLFLPVAIVSIFCKGSFCYHLHLNYRKSEKIIIGLISMLKKTYKVVFNSEFVKKCFLDEALFINIKKFILIENSLNEIQCARDFDSRVEEEIKCIAVFGRITPEKGQQVVVEVAKYFPNILFYIVGDSDFSHSDYKEHLLRNASNNVIFSGKCQNIHDFIIQNKIQISIVPSQWEEPFGLVAIESMAESCLTIVRRSGELINIANKTGAISFSSVDELRSILEKMIILSPEERVDLTRLQFIKTLSAYHQKNYKFQWVNSILNV